MHHLYCCQRDIRQIAVYLRGLKGGGGGGGVKRMELTIKSLLSPWLEARKEEGHQRVGLNESRGGGG